MEFQKAVKSRQKLRLAIDGISGSGKTYTALAIASGISDKIALIDTEHGSASLYADIFDFQTLELHSFQIEDYIEAIHTAQSTGFEVLIVDSTSHAWDALLERVEHIAGAKYGGNSFRAWAEGTPLQKKLIEAMLSYRGHLICTCRRKTEYSVERSDTGRTTVKKVGLAAVQRQGFEYEFTMSMSLDSEHVGFVSKDRTGKFQDNFIEKPGKDFGKELIAWLNDAPESKAKEIAGRKAVLWDLMQKNIADQSILAKEVAALKEYNDKSEQEQMDYIGQKTIEYAVPNDIIF